MPRLRPTASLPLLTPALLLAAQAASAQLIRPDAATAASEFSSAYDIGNAIDGSGLPVDFTLADNHATYTQNNHWTTRNGALAAGTAHATFFFDEAQTLGQFHLWNHLSNGVASNGYYAVTQFDLRFFDADGLELAAVLNQAAVGGVGGSQVQSFEFAAVSGVRSVWFGIDANSAPLGYSGVNYTGVAEVAFSAAPVPEAPSLALLLAGLGAVGVAVRRRTA